MFDATCANVSDLGSFALFEFLDSFRPTPRAKHRFVLPPFAERICVHCPLLLLQGFVHYWKYVLIFPGGLSKWKVSVIVVGVCLSF